jgi:hypothetical protein
MDDLLSFFTPEKENKIKNGVIRTYFLNDKLESEVTYNNDIKHGPYTYYNLNHKDAHILREKGTYNNGRYMGIIETYFLNGKLASEIVYNNGILHGPYTYYQLDKNNDNILFEKGTFYNGYYIGKIQRYDEDGRILWEYFKDGKGNYQGDHIIYNYNPNIRYLGKERYDGSYDIPSRSGDAKYIGRHEVYINNVGQKTGHIAQNLFPEPRHI